MVVGAGADARPWPPQNKPRILCVDDEPLVLEGLRDSLRRTFDVRVANSGADGLALLKENRRDYAVVISDMRMPVMSGSVFLREARRVAPLTVRMLLTGYADTDAAIAAVNDGQIFRFLTKPCDRDELIARLRRRALAAPRAGRRARPARADAARQREGADRRAGAGQPRRLRPGRAAEAGRPRARAETGWDDAWEVEVAAMLAQVGAVTLPEATAEKLYAGDGADRRGGGDGRARPRGHAADPRQHPAPGRRAADRRHLPAALRLTQAGDEPAGRRPHAADRHRLPASWRARAARPRSRSTTHARPHRRL